MSSNTRVTRSKGKSDGLSLPAMLRPRRKPTNMENDDGDTILNTTFDAGSSQHHPQIPAVPVASQKLMTSCIPLPRSRDSNTSLSTLSAPLFTEDIYSSISNDDVEICDAEITLINRQNKPNKTSTTHSTGGRPTSMPSTMDYTTQDDPASGTGTSTNYHTPNIQSCTSSQSNNHQPTISTVNPLYMFKHQPSWLMDHNSSLTYSNPSSTSCTN